MLKARWAKSTLYQHRRLWYRFRQYCHKYHLREDADAAVLFVAAHSVLPSSMITYTKSLKACLTAMRKCVLELSLFQKALQKCGASIPTRQAVPAPRDDFYTWFELKKRTQPRIALLCGLAWKSAARIGECGKLTPRSFLKVMTEEVVIDWGLAPKTAQTTGEPWRNCRYTVIVGQLTDHLAALLTAWLQTGPKAPLASTLSPQKIVSTLQASSKSTKWTQHSLKRGAVTHLMQVHATQSALRQDTFPLFLISRLAKHKETGDALSTTTLRYAAGTSPITAEEKAAHLAAAAALRTAEVTQHL